METINIKNVQLSPISKQRIYAAKSAHTTRRVNKDAIETLISGKITPKCGDVVLARVISIGHHKRLELINGRKAPLFVNDEIIVSFGHRYAPDQFEAHVPTQLEECHLVAAGGIASQCLSRHREINTPTAIEPLGLLGNKSGHAINLRDWALPAIQTTKPRPFIIAVAGTSMNAGKTTTAAHLIQGLTKSGMQVGAAKITGTGAGGDTWLMKDSGAREVFDFTDAGLVSTYKAKPDELHHVTKTLVNHLCQLDVDAIVLEVADGLYQEETSTLLQSAAFRHEIDGLIFAAGDAMGAYAGVQWLIEHQLPVIGISGCVSSSPLASREATQVSGLPVFSLEHLASEEICIDVIGQHNINMTGTNQ